MNWANDALAFKRSTASPLDDEKIKNRQMNDWKSFVKSTRFVFKAGTGMLDAKVDFKSKYANVMKCPFCVGSRDI